MASFSKSFPSWDYIHNELKKDKKIWDLFTKKEEYNNIKSNKNNILSYKSTFNKDIFNPIVSEYLKNKGFNFEYEDGKKFAVFLSHDVDDIDIPIRHLFRSCIPYPFHRDFFGFKRLISCYIKKEKPYLTMKKIINLERKYDATSTFYILATQKDVFGRKYNLFDIKEEITHMIDNNCEVGLHTGYFSFDDLKKIKNEKKKIESITNKRINGVRNHVFRFKTPRTWKLLSQAGFLYDSTFGYYDMIGFRNGMCHPFLPYDFKEKKNIDILEIPVCVVDVTLFSYMKFNAFNAWKQIKNLIDIVGDLNGVFTILWHNWTFSYPVSYAGLFGKEWTSLYEKVLDYCNKKKAWITSGENIAKYFKKNY
jgi:peptidoglycan/xylan/chitin deacetylase (PgdA/CDA1 family)